MAWRGNRREAACMQKSEEMPKSPTLRQKEVQLLRFLSSSKPRGPHLAVWQNQRPSYLIWDAKMHPIRVACTEREMSNHVMVYDSFCQKYFKFIIYFLMRLEKGCFPWCGAPLFLFEGGNIWRKSSEENSKIQKKSSLSLLQALEFFLGQALPNLIKVQ